jgi:hypothetical protein
VGTSSLRSQARRSHPARRETRGQADFGFRGHSGAAGITWSATRPRWRYPHRGRGAREQPRRVGRVRGQLCAARRVDPWGPCPRSCPEAWPPGAPPVRNVAQEDAVDR